MRLASQINISTALLFTLSLAFFLTEVLTADDSCSEQLSPCSCKTVTGKYIDLNPLSKGEPPVFSLPYSDSYTYQWDPCRQFDCSGTQVSACQTDFAKYIYPIGLQSTAKFGSDANGLFLHYEDGTSDKRSCKVYLKCNPSAGAPKYTVQGEPQTLEYQMTLEAKEVCPTDHASGGGGGDLSVGDILLIIFFVSIILYLLIGVVINIFVRKQSGTDAIPNKGFWLTLPGLVKDGGKLVVTKTKQVVRRDAYQPMT